MQILLLLGEFAAGLILLPVFLIFLWAFDFWDWITGETAREYRRKEVEWMAQQVAEAARQAEREREAERAASFSRERAEWMLRTGETSEYAWLREMVRREQVAMGKEGEPDGLLGLAALIANSGEKPAKPLPHSLGRNQS